MSVIAKRIFQISSVRNAISREKYLAISSSFSTGQDKNHQHYENQRKNNNKFLYFVGAAGLAAGGVSAYFLRDEGRVDAGNPVRGKYGEAVVGLPTYKMSEVTKHNGPPGSDRIWVSYRHGVYDITDFVDIHPGGDKILMAAGGSLEPFWQLYAVHKRPEVLGMLESYRIGNLSDSDIETVSMDDPYGKDPRRHPALKPASVTPFNAEPPPELLVDSFITPQDLFYVRNHLPVPEIDEDHHEVEITGVGMKPKILKMVDIKKLPKVTITAAMQCAGNRRSEMTKVKPVKGLDWGHAAIGNATWSGARLSDVLVSLGVNCNTIANHVQFEGVDVDPSNMPYGASIPIEKAMDPKGDVILAYEMNGEPLSRDHGAPLRVIVPGVTGARNVKWLGRIVVSEEESDSHWQQRDYKGFSPSIDWHNVDFSKSPAIQDLPVTSAICTPTDGQSVTPSNGKTIPVKGYAWSGGGRKIVRVDVTCDQGKNWHTAELTKQDCTNHPSHWAWTLWTIDLPFPVNAKECEIWVKAVDSSYNTQPESFDNIWNLRGVLSNAYHRICVKLSK